MINTEQAQLLRQVRLALQVEAYDKAIEGLKRVAELAHEEGDFGAESRHLGNLALIYYRIHQPQEALKYFDIALERARCEGDKLTEDGLLGNTGNILRELGRYDTAIDYLNRALMLANEIGDARGRGRWLCNLGLVYDDLKQSQQAMDYHQQSVAVARQLRDQSGLASRLGNLGNSYVAAGDYFNALKYFEEAVEVFKELNDQRGLAVRLGIMGNLYVELGRKTRSAEKAADYFQAALDYYAQTLTIARALEDKMSEAGLLQGMGNTCSSLGQFDQAIEHYQAAARLYVELGLYEQQRFIQHNIDVVIAYRDQETDKEQPARD